MALKFLNLKGEEEKGVGLEGEGVGRNRQGVDRREGGRQEGEEEGEALALPLEVVVFPLALNLKGEEMLSHATSLEGTDSDAAAFPLTTHKVGLNQADPVLDSQAYHSYTLKTPTRAAKAYPAEIPSCLAKVDPA